MEDDLDSGSTVRGLVAGQRVFQRYTLDRILGRGGMGVVWLARDEDLERNVALKFLPEVVAMDEQSVRELKRETRRSLELTHPNIIRIYDFIQDETTAAISMEWVAGKTLASLKLDQPHEHFETVQIEKWLTQLLDALTYAHDTAKIVHRDLKPANLMIDANDNLKIADFGIAASVSDSVSRISQQAGSSGTPVYMSPQQMMGESPEVTDDIYALGATIFDLLAGRPPFNSGNVMMQVLNKPAPLLSERRAESDHAEEEIPTAWNNAVAACLEKEAVDRPQTVLELRKLLIEGRSMEELVVSRSVSEPTHKPETPQRDGLSVSSPSPPKTSKNRKRWPLIAAVVVVLGAAGIGYSQWLEARKQAEIEAARLAAEEQAAREAAAAAAAEAERLAQEAAAAEAAEAERLKKLEADLRVELAQAEITWENVQNLVANQESRWREKRDELRRRETAAASEIAVLGEATQAIEALLQSRSGQVHSGENRPDGLDLAYQNLATTRSAAGVSEILALRNEVQSGELAIENLPRWLQDHPARLSRAKVEQLLSSEMVDDAATAMAELKASLSTLDSEFEEQSRGTANLGGAVILSTPENLQWSLVDALGQRSSGSTPETLSNLPPGVTLIRFDRENFPPLTEAFTVAAGEDVEVNAFLDSQAVRIETGREDVRIVYNGNEIGVGSAVLSDVSPGQHSLVLSTRGQPDAVVPITVAAESGERIESIDYSAMARREHSCPKCRGDGYLDVEIECDSCYGDGTRECRSCGGYGQISNAFYSGNCQNCRGRGYTSCRSCGGDGHQSEEKDCRTCSGNGMLSLLELQNI